MITVAVSGGFDPFHIGHLELFEKAKLLGDKLVVIVNSDDFLIKKKGGLRDNLAIRMRIIKSLRVVDEVVACVDTDDTVCETLRIIKPNIFGNGGDRLVGDEREEQVCKEIGCQTVFGLGGKIRKSSDYLSDAS